ncbi:transposase, partial [Prevotella jejuni]
MQLNNIFDSLGGDKRIERRVNSLFDKMVEKQSAVINKCFEDKAPKVGAYRVLRNLNSAAQFLVKLQVSEKQSSQNTWIC